jgi:hypothetical protein
VINKFLASSESLLRHIEQLKALYRVIGMSLIKQTKSQADVALKLKTCIREEPVPNLGVVVCYDDWGFYELPHYLHVNAKRVSPLRYELFGQNPPQLIIRRSPIQSELLTASGNQSHESKHWSIYSIEIVSLKFELNIKFSDICSAFIT